MRNIDRFDILQLFLRYKRYLYFKYSNSFRKYLVFKSYKSRFQTKQSFISFERLCHLFTREFNQNIMIYVKEITKKV